MSFVIEHILQYDHDQWHCMLQLPTKVMQSVLDDEAVQKVPPSFKIALAEHARSGKAVSVPLVTLQLVEAAASDAVARQTDAAKVEAGAGVQQQAPVTMDDT